MNHVGCQVRSEPRRPGAQPRPSTHRLPLDRPRGMQGSAVPLRIGIGALGLAAVLCVASIHSPRSATYALASAACCGLMGWLLGKDLAAPHNDPRQPPPRTRQEGAGCDRVKVVKAALENLHDETALGGSPLAHMSGMARNAQGVADLRGLLEKVINELATSPKPRDSEAGRLLLDYYVKRLGSHEVVMERLYLTRPTFYRRLKCGLALIARRVDDFVGEKSNAPGEISPQSVRRA